MPEHIMVKNFARIKSDREEEAYRKWSEKRSVPSDLPGLMRLSSYHGYNFRRDVGSRIQDHQKRAMSQQIGRFKLILKEAGNVTMIANTTINTGGS